MTKRQNKGNKIKRIDGEKQNRGEFIKNTIKTKIGGSANFG